MEDLPCNNITPGLTDNIFGNLRSFIFQVFVQIFLEDYARLFLDQKSLMEKMLVNNLLWLIIENCSYIFGVLNQILYRCGLYRQYLRISSEKYLPWSCRGIFGRSQKNEQVLRDRQGPKFGNEFWSQMTLKRPETDAKTVWGSLYLIWKKLYKDILRKLRNDIS